MKLKDKIIIMGIFIIYVSAVSFIAFAESTAVNSQNVTIGTEDVELVNVTTHFDGNGITDIMLRSDGKLEVVYRKSSNLAYPCYPCKPVPDSLKKYIFCASNEVIILEKMIVGRVVPEKTVPERIEWTE